MDPFEQFYGQSEDDPLDALRKLLRDLGLPDDIDVNDAQARTDLFRTMMQRFMPSEGMSDDEMVWSTVRQMARHLVASLGPDPSGSSRAARQVSDAVHLAELWLSEATVLPPVSMTSVVWSRAEWIENTLAAWKSMLEPVIGILTAGVNDATRSHFDVDSEAETAEMQAVLRPLVSKAISAMFGAHVGEGLGQAATSTMTGTDFGLPLIPEPIIATLPTNLAAVQHQTDLEEEGLLLYCSLREVARQRLFHEVAWIAPQIIALVQHYAREMRVDPDVITTVMENAVIDHLSADNLASQSDFSALLFAPDQSEEQIQILARLHTLLALVEGWVDNVTSTVAHQWFPGWEPIAESLRRHRATSKSGRSIVTPLIGLGASTKAVRDAASFWETIRVAKGIEGRDEIWKYPESMPEPHDISDPQRFLNKALPENDPFDDELRKFLGEG
ncbi:MAG: zinc-dependent metalloprotease [Propionibacteriaceae bacterium]|jgi:putative hydrolase|nr:zinc-dependent metalloprotease [Propionibacteriaceae bacterium]